MYKNIGMLRSFDTDNGGRRSGQDRRRFAYSNHIPERRLRKEYGLSQDRRNGRDRRKALCDRHFSDLRRDRRFERRIAHRQFTEKLQQSSFRL